MVGLVERDRKTVEELYSFLKIQVMIATATLACAAEESSSAHTPTNSQATATHQRSIGPDADALLQVSRLGVASPPARHGGARVLHVGKYH